jgi:crotonobetainyl-CoA:carnitine CoA-transferase CaiB-like acyl-CoA transferase
LAPYATLSHDQTTLSSGPRIVSAADGWIAIAARTPEQLAAAIASVGADDAEGIAGAVAGQTVADVLEQLTNSGVPVEEVRLNQRDAFFDSPANRAAGLVAQYRQAEWGAMLQPGAMWYFGDLGVRLELAPPALGEHTMSVLTDLGFSPADVATLVDNGTALTLVTAATAQP